MSQPGAGFCIECGSVLEPAHRFCWSCGSQRWQAGGAPAVAPPPGPGTQPFAPPPTAAETARRGQDAGVVRALTWLFAAGGVYWLVFATQSLAYLLSADGRRQMAAQLSTQNLQAASPVVTLGFTVGLALVAAVLHGAVYYGLRARRFWGWLIAVMVSVAYSFALVGIPILYLLLRRGTRSVFGVGAARQP